MTGRAPLRQRGRRAAAKHARDFGAQAARCRSLPCSVCVALRLQQVTRTEAHHEPPRSRGGADRDTLPLCSAHHAARHNYGARAFWTSYRIDPEAVLAAVRLGTPTPGDPHSAIPY